MGMKRGNKIVEHKRWGYVVKDMLHDIIEQGNTGLQIYLYSQTSSLFC